MSEKPTLSDFISRDFWSSLVDLAFGSESQTSTPVYETIKTPENDPYARDYDELISIQQKGSRGFRTIDIDPNLLSREEYSPALDQVILNQLVGGESGQWAQANGIPEESTTMPFWRTIGFQLNANFLKVEYLPSPINDSLNADKIEIDNSTLPYFQTFGYVEWSAQTNLPKLSNGGSGDQQSYLCVESGVANFGAGPIAFTIGDVIEQNQTTLIWGKVGTAPVESQVTPYVTVKWASDRMILINFEDTTSAPLIAKHGDVFKIPFNTVYLTLKTWSPRIRLTVGYNAEIESQTSDLDGARSLAFAGGHGFLENQYIHYVPFNIANENIAAASINALNMPITNSSDPTAVATKKVVLIVNAGEVDDHPYPGVLYGWLNSFTLSSFRRFWLASGDSDRIPLNADLCVANATTLEPIRRLAQAQNVLSKSFAQDKMTLTFNEPIRFSLHTNECLMLFLKANRYLAPVDETVNIFPYVSVQGYTYGNVVGTGIGANFTPFFPGYLTTQSSYPQDRCTIGAPK